MINTTKENFKIDFPYAFNSKFKKKVAYFSMEFAIDQSLKTYSGGLGFLAGSHMRSVYDLKQNEIGIGILWKYGYYDQGRNKDNTLKVDFREKIYHFLEDTNIRFQITIQQRNVWVAAYYLPATVFGSAPMIFLTTDTDGNDEAARKISYHLYDADHITKISQCILLGIGGAKFLDEIGYNPDIYHLNEAHAVPGLFYLYEKWNDIEKLKNHTIFTTHTPEEAGNDKSDFHLLQYLNFYSDLDESTVREITGIDDNVFNYSLAALRMSKKANGVSALHGEVSRGMWGHYDDICEISHVTNAQNKKYWVDSELEAARVKSNFAKIDSRKKELKATLFKEVADQAGKLFDPNVLTIVWARRFAGYKRADLLTRDRERFDRIMRNTKYPVQFIWAGKPYPHDHPAIETFNNLFFLSHLYPNMAVLTGYELKLSKLLKDGSDIWLNNPVVTREASGTSGMTAAMNASVNFSTYDGWVCEFAKNNENSFIVPVAEAQPDWYRDGQDLNNMLDMLENTILPTYYENKEKWGQIVLNSMNDVAEFFDSTRMATEYYEKMYNA